MPKKSSINHSALPCLSSLSWRILNCSYSQHAAVRSAGVLWSSKLSTECLRDLLKISQQSKAESPRPLSFPNWPIIFHLKENEKNPRASLPRAAMRKHGVFKGRGCFRVQSCWVVWTWTGSAEAEPSGATAAGTGQGWQCPGTCR